MEKNLDSIRILYEDKDIIVCVKPHGIATQSKKAGQPDMVSRLKNVLYREHPEKGEPYLAVIHRLDQPVKGILIFAKTAKAAKELNRQLQNRGFGKYYHALVDGSPEQPEGSLEDYLVKDGRTNTSSVCTKNTPGAKLARLHYQVISRSGEQTLLDIHLDTGRHHQIRVQLANTGCPIVGDTKYNPNARMKDGWQEIQLCAYRLDFRHPITQKEMHFHIDE